MSQSQGRQSLTRKRHVLGNAAFSYLVISRAESRKSLHCLPQKVSTQPKPAADLAWRVPILFFAEHTNSAANISLEAAVRSRPKWRFFNFGWNRWLCGASGSRFVQSRASASTETLMNSDQFDGRIVGSMPPTLDTSKMGSGTQPPPPYGKTGGAR